MLVYTPGWTLLTIASKFWSYAHPKKVCFSAAKKWKYPINVPNCQWKLLFCLVSAQKIQTIVFGSFCLKFCHADLDFREQQAILLLNMENSRPKMRFLFFRRNVRHAVLRRPSRTRSGPTRLIRPRPIDCNRGSEETVEIFPVFGPFFLASP